MLLEDRTAVIYGAGGAIGGAVARSFARERAGLFLTGRDVGKADAVAEEIVAAGGEDRPRPCQDVTALPGGPEGWNSSGAIGRSADRLEDRFDRMASEYWSRPSSWSGTVVRTNGVRRG